MKYAILSDVHANPAALRAVLDDARRQGVDKVICLGDVVGYGPEAEESVRIVRAEAEVCLMGNHDAAVSAVITGSGFSLPAVRGIMRHRAETSVESRQWLASLPYVWEGDGFACAHGDFSDPQGFRYVMTPEDAEQSLALRSEHLLFFGHTHAVAVLEKEGVACARTLELEDAIRLKVGCRYVMNVGAVGYPRHDNDSTYCIYDSERGEVRFRRIPFDFKGYERAMLKRGAALPAWFDNVKRQQCQSGGTTV